MILNLGIGGRGLKFYKGHINADPGLTLTDLTARSNLVTYAFRCRKTLIKPFNGKNIVENDQIDSTFMSLGENN